MSNRRAAEDAEDVERAELFADAPGATEGGPSGTTQEFRSNAEVLQALVKEGNKFADITTEDNEGLQRDGETVSRIEGHVEDLEDINQKAKYLSKSFSFWGRIKNLFRGPPKSKKKKKKGAGDEEVAKRNIFKQEQQEKKSEQPYSTNVTVKDSSGPAYTFDGASTLSQREKELLGQYHTTMDQSLSGMKAHSATLDSQKRRLETAHERMEKADSELTRLHAKHRIMAGK